MPFYCYQQNNSGGSFRYDKNLSCSVIVEADNADKANSKAEDIGIYFNGVNKKRDCKCCGDRWSPAYEDDKRFQPCVYDTPVFVNETRIEEQSLFLRKGTYKAIVHYIDGTIAYFFADGTHSLEYDGINIK